MNAESRITFSAHCAAYGTALLLHVAVMFSLSFLVSSRHTSGIGIPAAISIESLAAPLPAAKIAVKPILKAVQKPGLLPAKVPSPATGGSSGSISPLAGHSKETIAQHGSGEGNPANRGMGEGTGSGAGTGIPSPGSDVYRVGVESAPEPFGGLPGIIAKIPQSVFIPSLSGRSIYVTAFIDDEGIVRKVHLSKGTGEPVDEYAVAAVRRTKFKPGRDKGRIVKTQIVLNLRLP